MSNRYTLEPGRYITRDGVPLAVIGRAGDTQPAEVDRFAREVVDLLNTQGEPTTTGWRPYPHYGFTHFRLWRRFDGTQWWQRHEWKRENGTTDLEDWIKGPKP